MAKEQTYYVKGMHCAACEVLIEKKLLEIPGVFSVEASTCKNRAVIEYEGEKPDIKKLNEIFQKDNYTFSDESVKNESQKPGSRTLLAFNIAIFITIAFLLLGKTGVSGLFSVGSSSSVFAFFGFGVLAGLSSCAALVGGIVLSMSKQWYRLQSNRVSSMKSGQAIYLNEKSIYKKIQPHVLFNAGRILSYVIFGGLLGLLGSRLQISLGFTSFLVIAVSLLMIALALQMLGVKYFRKFQISLPKFITRNIANENNFQGKYMPFLMGAATFFLPCGFTITAQSLALLSGNYLQGALMMGFFALGTAPMLLFIGFSSVKFFEKPHLSLTFSKVAGFLILFFALFNIYNQANVLGYFDQATTQSYSKSNLAAVVDGKQVIKMTASGLENNPDYFLVKAGIPVRWEITAASQLGCNGAIVSNKLFSGAVNLIPGQVTVKEFTPQSEGKYRFSCTMGMVTGTIEVIN